MQNNKLLRSYFSIAIFAGFLVGCASGKHLDDGTVIREKKIAGKNYAPHKGTLIGATAGAGVGASTGAVIGAVGGAGAGIALTVGTLGLAAPMIPALVTAGAASGAVVGGATGGAAGAGVGYASDIYKQGAGVYEFVIKPDNRPDNITVSQYISKPIPPHSRVQILLKNDRYYIVPAFRS